MKKISKAVLSFINRKPKDYGQDINDILDSEINVKPNIEIDSNAKVSFKGIRAIFKRRF